MRSAPRRVGRRADVSEHHRRVAHQTAQLRALHGTPLERRAELVLCQRQNIARERRRILANEELSRGERRSRGQFPSELHIPRTHILTDVATIDQLSHRLAQRERNLILQFDREIRDAPCRIKLARRNNGARGTRIDAARTRSAPVRLERRVGLELEIEHQRTEKKEGAERGIEQVGVLAEPAKARASREIALEQRSGVHIRFARDCSADDGFHPRVQFAELRVHDIVIVVASRVPRDGAARLASPVVERHDDRVRRAGHWPAGVPPLLRTARQVVHDARMSGVDPCVERIRRVSGTKGGNPRQLEAERVCVRLGEARELGARVTRELGAVRRIDHGSRTAQRAYRSTSSGGGMASASP